MNTSTNRVVQSFLILLFAFPAILPALEKHPQDNLTILTGLASTVAEHVFDEIQPDSNETIIINSAGQNLPGNWIIVNAFVQHLLKQKKSVQLDVEADSRGQLVVELQPDQLGVRYFSTAQKDKIGREIFLGVDVRVKRGLVNQVLFFKKFDEQYSDSLQADSVKFVENNNYPFTQGDIPERNSLKKYIQPFVVLTITGSVIYSFFVLRSK